MAWPLSVQQWYDFSHLNNTRHAWLDVHSAYGKVVTSRVSNLRRNAQLVRRVKSGEVSPEELATMTPEQMRTEPMARKAAAAADR